MKKITLAIMLGITLIITGCKSVNNDTYNAEYNNMKNAYKDMKYSIDIENYEPAILFIVSPDNTDNMFTQDNRIRFKDIIEDNVFNKLQLMAIQPVESNGQSMENDDAGGYEEETAEQNELYPIYGNHYEVIGYGTKEESEQSIEDFQHLPDNVIKSVSIYKELLLIKLDNKYTGEFLLRLTLKNEKIVDFKILR